MGSILVQHTRQPRVAGVRVRAGGITRAAVVTLGVSAILALAFVGWLAWQETAAERCLLEGGRVARGTLGVACQAPVLP